MMLSARLDPAGRGAAIARAVEAGRVSDEPNMLIAIKYLRKKGQLDRAIAVAERLPMSADGSERRQELAELLSDKLTLLKAEGKFYEAAGVALRLNSAEEAAALMELQKLLEGSLDMVARSRRRYTIEDVTSPSGLL